MGSLSDFHRENSFAITKLGKFRKLMFFLATGTINFFLYILFFCIPKYL